MTRNNPNKTMQFFRSSGLAMLLLALGFGVAGCQTKPGNQEKHYPITGTVSAVDAQQKAVTLDHEAIPGYMQAMEMEFAVAEPQLLEGIAVGDQVQGELTVHAGGTIITRLKKKPHD